MSEKITIHSDDFQHPKENKVDGDKIVISFGDIPSEQISESVQSVPNTPILTETSMAPDPDGNPEAERIYKSEMPRSVSPAYRCQNHAPSPAQRCPCFLCIGCGCGSLLLLGMMVFILSFFVEFHANPLQDPNGLQIEILWRQIEEEASEEAIPVKTSEK